MRDVLLPTNNYIDDDEARLNRAHAQHHGGDHRLGLVETASVKAARRW